MYVQAGDDLPEFASWLSGLHDDSGETILLFLAAAEAPRLPAVIASLKARKVPFFGGIFPAVYRGGERFRREPWYRFTHRLLSLIWLMDWSGMVSYRRYRI